MAKEQWDFVFDQVLGHEGAYSSIRSDPGNWTGGKVGVGKLLGTKYGIAANTYPDLDIKNLTVAQAKAIYKRDFWDRLRCDELPEGVDLAVFDSGVNSGRSRAAKWLQASVDVAVDGILGPATVKATQAQPDPAQLVDELCDRRLDFLQDQPTWRTFGTGWSRRVANIRKVGKQMVKNAQAVETPAPGPNYGLSEEVVGVYRSGGGIPLRVKLDGVIYELSRV